MRKGQQLIDVSRQAISFLPTNIPEMEPEVFLDISPIAFPEIIPYYMISNYGRLWHKYKRIYLMGNIDSKGYLYKPLATKEGNKNYRIHRLVLATFGYVPGCEELLINHIDGVKTNCYYKNLEWCNYSENAIHAWNNNLIAKEHYEKDLVVKICELLQEGKMTFKEISELLGCSYSLVQAINQRRVHVDISKDYVFKTRKINTIFTEEQIRKICKYIANYYDRRYELGINNLAIQAIKSIGVDNPTGNQVTCITKIINKDSFSYISNNYF